MVRRNLLALLAQLGQFNWPEGVAIDRDGNILVVDQHNHCIQKFSSAGKVIKAIGGECSNEPQQFNYPHGIAIHPHTHRIYVADTGNGRIQILNPDLTLCSSFGQKGSKNGEFLSPNDIAIDSVGNLYITDQYNHRIQVFSPDGVCTLVSLVRREKQMENWRILMVLLLTPMM